MLEGRSPYFPGRVCHCQSMAFVMVVTQGAKPRMELLPSKWDTSTGNSRVNLPLLDGLWCLVQCT